MGLVIIILHKDSHQENLRLLLIRTVEFVKSDFHGLTNCQIKFREIRLRPSSPLWISLNCIRPCGPTLKKSKCIVISKSSPSTLLNFVKNNIAYPECCTCVSVWLSSTIYVLRYFLTPTCLTLPSFFERNPLSLAWTFCSRGALTRI